MQKRNRIELLLVSISIITILFCNSTQMAEMVYYNELFEHINAHKLIIENPIKKPKIGDLSPIFKFTLNKNKSEILNDESNINTKNDVEVNISPNNSEETHHKTEPKEKYASNYVGRFKIKSEKVNVACYNGHYQFIVDKKDSAAYFYGYTEPSK